MHCEFLTARGYYENALKKNAPHVEKAPVAFTVRHSPACIEAIQKAKGAGQLFHTIGGTHLNSNEFFQARALETRLEDAQKMEDNKKNCSETIAVEAYARDILSSKGQLTLENEKSFNLKELKVLLKWKGLKTQKNKTTKKHIVDLCLAKPPPPPIVPWSDAEETRLQELKDVAVPMEQTALGVATKQMVANSIHHLDEEPRHSLLQSLASFEASNPAMGA